MRVGIKKYLYLLSTAFAYKLISTNVQSNYVLSTALSVPCPGNKMESRREYQNIWIEDLCRVNVASN